MFLTPRLESLESCAAFCSQRLTNNHNNTNQQYYYQQQQPTQPSSYFGVMGYSVIDDQTLEFSSFIDSIQADCVKEEPQPVPTTSTSAVASSPVIPYYVETMPYEQQSFLQTMQSPVIGYVSTCAFDGLMDFGNTSCVQGQGIPTPQAPIQSSTFYDVSVKTEPASPAREADDLYIDEVEDDGIEYVEDDEEDDEDYSEGTETEDEAEHLSRQASAINGRAVVAASNDKENNNQIAASSRFLNNDQRRNMINNNVPAKQQQQQASPRTPPASPQKKIQKKNTTSPQSDSKRANRSSPERFSLMESERLRECVEIWGLGNWKVVAGKLGTGKTAAQCAQHFKRVIVGRECTHVFSKEEDEYIERRVKAGIRSWKQIAAEMGNHTDIQCRYRYHYHIRGKKAKKVR